MQNAKKRLSTLCYISSAALITKRQCQLDMQTRHNLCLFGIQQSALSVLQIRDYPSPKELIIHCYIVNQMRNNVSCLYRKHNTFQQDTVCTHMLGMVKSKHSLHTISTLVTHKEHVKRL